MKASMKMRKMKASKAMKSMRRMKRAKKVSKIAKGRGAKARVFSGKKEKTVGGLVKSALTKNKAGKVVSKKRSAYAKKMFAKRIGGWTAAVNKARKALGVKGFQAVGGKSAK